MGGCRAHIMPQNVYSREENDSLPSLRRHYRQLKMQKYEPDAIPQTVCLLANKRTGWTTELAGKLTSP